MNSLKRKEIPVSNLFDDGELILLGNFPEKIRALSIDIDGTFYPKDHPFFLARSAAQEQWLSRRIMVSVPELRRRIARERKKIERKNGRRASLSQIVYRLDDSITGEEWTKAMVRSMSNSFNCRLAKNPTLEEAINDLTGCRSNGVRIIFETNAPVQVAATVLKMIFGSRIFNHGAFGIVGHGKKLSKPDPAFFTDLVLPELLSKGVSLAHTISIGDRVDDDGIAAIEAGMPGAIIVDGPDGLLQALQEIKKLKKIEP